jgi:NAD(P)H-dependent flavin oxidoreductase YrpB (nitropropane dioxygenase family)
MVGHPKHVPRALKQGVDIICAQGGEGGGHTGDTPSSILIPACVDAVKGHKSPLTGQPVMVVGAGGVFDGRGLAANLMWGADAVWVGTRFVASVEAGAPKKHKELLLSAGYDDTIRTLIYTGRPLSVRRTPFITDWETNRQDEIKKLTSQGKLPIEQELKEHPEKSLEARSWLMGKVAGSINDILSAKEIVDSMVNDAAAQLRRGNSLMSGRAKL